MFGLSHGYKIHRLSLELKKSLRALKPYNLTLMDIFVLQAAAEEGVRKTQYDLSKEMHLEPARINQVIKKLEKEELVTLIDISENDRIKKYIEPSGTALELCVRFKQDSISAVESTLRSKGYDDEQIASTKAVMIEATDQWYESLA